MHLLSLSWKWGVNLWLTKEKLGGLHLGCPSRIGTDETTHDGMRWMCSTLKPSAKRGQLLFGRNTRWATTGSCLAKKLKHGWLFLPSVFAPLGGAVTGYKINLGTGNGTEGAMGCTNLVSLLHLLFDIPISKRFTWYMYRARSKL